MADINISIAVDSAGAVTGIANVGRALEEFDAKVVASNSLLSKLEEHVKGSFRAAIDYMSRSFILGAAGIGVFFDELVKVNVEYEKVRLSLIAGANSAQGAAANFAFVRAEATKMGLPISAVGVEFSRLTAAAKGTALQGKPVRELFDSFATAGVALGKSEQSMSRVYLALSEMLGTVRITGREARLQLGQQIPGAFKALAEAAGFVDKDGTAHMESFIKAISKGGVNAVEVLGKVPEIIRAKYGDAFKAALESSPQLALGQLKNAVESALYTLGQAGGFMTQFVGLIRDIQGYLASDVGAKQMQGLANSLGLFMQVIRGGADFAINHIQTITALLTGMTAGSIVIGLRAVGGLLAAIVGEATLVDVLASPWILAAAAIGAAVFVLMRFGDDVVTIGGQSARVVDFVTTGFQMIGQAITTATQNLLTFINHIPVIGDTIRAATEGFNVFKSMSNTPGTKGLDAVGAGVSTFNSQLDTGPSAAAIKQIEELAKTAWQTVSNLGRAFGDGIQAFLFQIQPMFASVADSANRAYNAVATATSGLGEGIMNGLRSLPALASGLTPLFDQLGIALANTLGGVVTHIGVTFSNLVQTIAPSLAKIPALLDSIGKSDAFQFLLTAAGVAGTALVNIFLGSINAIGVAFQFIVDEATVTFNALAPIVAPVFTVILDFINNIASKLNSALSPDTASAAWGTFGTVVQLALNIVAGLVGSVVGLVTLISGIAGPIVTALEAAVRGIWNVIAGTIDVFGTLIGTIVQAFTGGGQKISGSMQAASLDSEAGWVKAGNVIVGVILTIIQVVGVAVEGIGLMVRSLGDVASRGINIVGAAGSASHGDFAGAKDQLTKAFANWDPKPANQFVADVGAIGSKLKSNFSVVSDAVKNGVAASKGVQDAGHGLMAGFTQFNPRGTGSTDPAFLAQEQAGIRLNAQAAAGGTPTAGPFDKLIQSWTTGAARATVAARDAAAKAQAAKELLQRQQAAALLAEDQAGKDAAQVPDDSPEKKAKKTFADRANDQVRALNATMGAQQREMAVLDQQSVSYKELNAITAANNAVKAAGYYQTVKHTAADQAAEAQLYKTAYAAELVKQKYTDLVEAQKDIAKSQQAIDGYNDQIALAQDLTTTQQEYNAQLAATVALRARGFGTYQQVINDPKSPLTAINLAQVKYNESLTSSAAKAAEAIATYDRGLPQTYADVAAFNSVVGLGTAPLSEVSAEISAQQAVMQKLGTQVFDQNSLLDTNTRLLYDNALALARAGGSADSYAKNLNSVADAYQKVNDPIAASRTTITRAADEQARQLAAGRDLALRGNFANETSGSIDTDQFMAKRTQILDQYDTAVQQLGVTTHDNLIHNSNDIGDSLEAAFKDYYHSANNWGENTKKLFTDVFDGMADAISTWVTTGKLSFSDLATSVIGDLAKMIAKMLEAQAIQFALNTFFPGSGSVASLLGFANGGIMTSSGSMPLNRYANGGVASSPQLAMFGEGRSPEAYVPLPDGRSIPVTMKGGGTSSTPSNLSSMIAQGITTGFTSIMAQSFSSLPSERVNSTLNATPSSTVRPYSSSGGGGSSSFTGGNIELHTHVTVAAPAVEHPRPILRLTLSLPMRSLSVRPRRCAGWSSIPSTTSYVPVTH